MTALLLVCNYLHCVSVYRHFLKAIICTNNPTFSSSSGSFKHIFPTSLYWFSVLFFGVFKLCEECVCVWWDLYPAVTCNRSGGGDLKDALLILWTLAPNSMLFSSEFTLWQLYASRGQQQLVLSFLSVVCTNLSVPRLKKKERVKTVSDISVVLYLCLLYIYFQYVSVLKNLLFSCSLNFCDSAAQRHKLKPATFPCLYSPVGGAAILSHVEK